jgi:hypothetical protein
MHLAEIWRYPVKSMAAELRADGVAGDRLVVPVGADGSIVTARTRPALLGHRATQGPDGEALVDGLPWRDPSVASAVEAAAGAGTHLVRLDGVERFDVLPLLVATDGAIAAFGRDGRRLRPNLVVGGVAGLAERTWEGRVLRIGTASPDAVRVRAAHLRDRCVMTTYDPDTLAQDPGVLRDIVERFDGVMALDAEILRGGVIRVGDPVELEPRK